MKKWAWLLAALSILVVLSSVVLRLDAGYPSCIGDPGCVKDAPAAWGWALPIAAIRAAHRATASIALVLAIAFAWKYRRSPLARHGRALVLLMLFLAVVGMTGSGPDAVWGRFANILGGLGLLALSGRLLLATAAPAAVASRPAVAPVLRAGLAALAATFVLGALIGARFAAAACTSLPDCGGIWWPTAEGWAGLDPRIVLSPAPLHGESAAVALHLLHRYCAAAALLLLGFAGFRGLRQRETRTPSLFLLSLLIMEAMLGGLSVTTSDNLWPMAGHALFAGLVLVGSHWLSSAERRVASA